MRKLSFILLALLATVTANAGLTLDECQRKARANYPEIVQYDLIAQSGQYNLESAARGWIPQITLSGQVTWQSAVASFPEQLTQMLEAQGVSMPGIAQDQYKVALDVQQTIWDGGVSKANRQLAKSEAEEQRLSNDVSMYSLEKRINDIFFGILLLDENYETALSRKELFESNLHKLESLRRNGSALQSDLDLVRVELLSLQQQMDQNRSSRANFAAMLSIFIGEDAQSQTLEKPSLQVIAPLSGAMRPEIRLLDAKIATLDARSELLGASLTPKFSFFAQGYYGNPGLDMFKSMTSRDWTWNAYLGVRAQWNISALFTFGTDRKKIDNARQLLETQKKTFTFNNDLQLTQQNSEIARMQKALQGDDEIVQLRSNVRRTAESQRENGIIDTSTLIQRIMEESAAINARSIHEIELLKTIYELKHTQGK